MSWFSKVTGAVGSMFGPESKEQVQESYSHIDSTMSIIQHISGTLGPIYSHVSFNMFESGEPLTIIIVEPSEGRDYYTLVTSGMSHKAMVNPNDPEKMQHYSELVICLPASWNAPRSEDDVAGMSDQDRWPLNFLLMLAEFPHKHETFLSYGQTVGLGGNYKEFTRAFITFTHLNPEFEFMVDDHHMDIISFLGVYPITEAEFNLKKERGSDELEDLLQEKGLGLVFDENRKSTV